MSTVAIVSFIAFVVIVTAMFLLVTWPTRPSGRVVVRGDSAKNQRFRWYLVDKDGSAIAMCTGSFAEAEEAERAADQAVRTMRRVCR